MSEAILPFVAETDDDDVDIKVLTRMVGAGAAAEKRRAEVIRLDDGLDKELVLKLCEDFSDARNNSRLDLSTGPLLFSYFRHCLRDTAKEDWDAIVAGVNEMVANFNARKDMFVELYIEPTDFETLR